MNKNQVIIFPNMVLEWKIPSQKSSFLLTWAAETKAKLLAQLQGLSRLHSLGSKEIKSTEITSVDEVLDTIPSGKEVLLEGIAVGNYQTPLFSKFLY